MEWIYKNFSTNVNLSVHTHACTPTHPHNQAWGEVLWYLYLRTLKYTYLSTCTYT